MRTAYDRGYCMHDAAAFSMWGVGRGPLLQPAAPGRLGCACSRSLLSLPIYISCPPPGHTARPRIIRPNKALGPRCEVQFCKVYILRAMRIGSGGAARETMHTGVLPHPRDVSTHRWDDGRDVCRPRASALLGHGAVTALAGLALHHGSQHGSQSHAARGGGDQHSSSQTNFER